MLAASSPAPPPAAPTPTPVAAVEETEAESCVDAVFAAMEKFLTPGSLGSQALKPLPIPVETAYVAAHTGRHAYLL